MLVVNLPTPEGGTAEYRLKESRTWNGVKQFDPIMLSQLVDHGHIGRCPPSLSHDGRADIQIIWITPPRFRAVNPSSDRNRDAKRFGHAARAAVSASGAPADNTHR